MEPVMYYSPEISIVVIDQASNKELKRGHYGKDVLITHDPYEREYIVAFTNLKGERIVNRFSTVVEYSSTLSQVVDQYEQFFNLNNSIAESGYLDYTASDFPEYEGGIKVMRTEHLQMLKPNL